MHHLVDKLGVELGYRMSEDTGYDVEDCITCARGRCGELHKGGRIAGHR